METVTGQPASGSRRVRRERSATESLLSIALILESLLVFFVTLSVYGLKALDAPVAFAGGGVFLLLLVVASALQRYRAGVWLGWVLQAALLATGLLVPLMYFIGGVFVATWIFCFVRGRQLDSQKAAYLAEFGTTSDHSNPDNPGSPTTDNPKENIA